MIIINTVSETTFSLNGINFAKIYQPLNQGTEAIGIYNVFDTRQQLLNSTKFDEFSIDTVTYATQELTIAAILKVIYNALISQNIKLVDTVAEFAAIDISDFTTAILTDIDRGGTFIYDATKVGDSNGGTNFNGWIRQYTGAVSVKWFGAVGDGVTDDIVSIQAAIDAVIATDNGYLFFDAGTYSYSTSIIVPTEGLQLIGSGVSYTNLLYTGSAEAIKIVSAGHELSISKIIFKDFTITGNSNATYGIYILPVSSHYSNGVIEGVRITGFSKVGAYALYMQETYSFKVSNFVLEGNDGGLYCGIEVIGTEFSNFWIRDNVQKGVHVDGGTAFNVVFESGIIDSPNLVKTNLNFGIYISAGHAILNNIHFEDVYTPLKAVGGLTVCDRVFFAGGITDNPIVEGDANMFLSDCQLSLAYEFEASVSTFWSNNNMYVVPATYNIGAAETTFSDRFGTVVKVASVTAENIFGWNAIDSLRMSDITILFQDNNVTLVNGIGVAPGYFILRDSLKWNPYNGDSITFRPIGQIGTENIFQEVSRHFLSVLIKKTADFNVVDGDSGRTFTNEGAGGLVTAQLFNTLAEHEGMEVTFSRQASQTFRIQPQGFEIVGAGGGGKYLSLDSDGASVTLKLYKLNVWDIVTSNGTISYEA